MNRPNHLTFGKLVVKDGPSPGQEFELSLPETLIGRDPSATIVMDVPSISRRHARVVRTSSGYLLEDLGSSNGTLINGQRLSGRAVLEPGSQVSLGKTVTFVFLMAAPGTVVDSRPVAEAPRASEKSPQEILFGSKPRLQFGRDSGNDVVLESPTVSRFHAQIDNVGGRYCLRDLRSSNGTFVNDQRISGEVWLAPQDTFRIGPYRFVAGRELLTRYDETHGLHVDAIRLNKWVRQDLNILQDISLIIKPREFIVVVGQSGGGKSTLVDAIAGYRPATHGRVLVNGIDIYQNFDAIRHQIGFVPQKDIIHTELTIYQALDYAAQLRMPPDTSRAERQTRVMQVLHELDLEHRKDVQISGLSGGQQKRVSIGVELLTGPGLFFLDEPTSGLDPGSETALMHLLRRLADQGRTIVMITHATKNVMLADKIVFLARGGYLAWYGPPEEAVRYFAGYRAGHDGGQRPPAASMEFDEIYTLLDNAGQGTPVDWAERYRDHPASQTYIMQPLMEHIRTPQTAVPPPGQGRSNRRPPVNRPVNRQVSAFRQFLILTSRNLKILTRDRFSLVLILAAAPLISLLDVLLAVLLGRNPFDYSTGNMRFIVISLFQMTMYGILVSGLAQMREFVKELDIYRRERLVSLKIVPYVLSKVSVAALLALFHAGVYVGIHYLAFQMPGGLPEVLLFYITMVLLTFTGMMMGLFASALAPNANAAPLLLVLLILPQLILGGAMVPIPRLVSAPSAASWAFEALMGITGAGSDVAGDVCWDVPEDVRRLMTLENKAEFGCRCMGLNMLDPASCNFPGLGRFASPAVQQPAPVEPARLGDPPPKPVLPPRPAEPADPADNVAVAEYLNQLQTWEARVNQIQTAYELEVEGYQSQVRVYQAELLAYQQEMGMWRIARESVTRAAEETVNIFNQDYGWAFVEKNDRTVFWRRIGAGWLAEIVISSLLFLGILILQKRRDLL